MSQSLHNTDAAADYETATSDTTFSLDNTRLDFTGNNSFDLPPFLDSLGPDLPVDASSFELAASIPTTSTTSLDTCIYKRFDNDSNKTRNDDFYINNEIVQEMWRPTGAQNYFDLEQDTATTSPRPNVRANETFSNAHGDPNTFGFETSHQHRASPTLSTQDLEISKDPIVIGLILSNGIPRHDKYKCQVPTCTGVKTFSRLADLKRHNASKHNRQGARFWCPVDGCERSMKSGGRAFPRKDKMFDHLERVHADKVGLASE